MPKKCTKGSTEVSDSVDMYTPTRRLVADLSSVFSEEKDAFSKGVWHESLNK